jgi:hypothetical protein
VREVGKPVPLTREDPVHRLRPAPFDRHRVRPITLDIEPPSGYSSPGWPGACECPRVGPETRTLRLPIAVWPEFVLDVRLPSEEGAPPLRRCRVAVFYPGPRLVHFDTHEPDLPGRILVTDLPRIPGAPIDVLVLDAPTPLYGRVVLGPRDGGVRVDVGPDAPSGPPRKPPPSVEGPCRRAVSFRGASPASGHAVEVRVRDEAGWPVPSAEVVVTTAEDPAFAMDGETQLIRLLADSAGRLVLRDLPAGPVTVRARSTGLDSETREIGTETRIDLVIDRAWRPQWVLPEIDTEVVAVDGDANVVRIAAGSRDGVVLGLGFTVYRGGEYVGKLVIEEVGKTASRGYMVPEVSKEMPRVGDRASTVL